MVFQGEKFIIFDLAWGKFPTSGFLNYLHQYRYKNLQKYEKTGIDDKIALNK